MYLTISYLIVHFGGLCPKRPTASSLPDDKTRSLPQLTARSAAATRHAQSLATVNAH